MNEQRKLHLVLCWHMHQPDYRQYGSNEFDLPWTYLHAIKDYTDMAYHLEQYPSAKAVFNFVPILLEQLEDYSAQFSSGKIRDPLLRLLALEDMAALAGEDRDLLLSRCFSCNHETMILPYPCYQHLYEIWQLLNGHGEKRFNYLSGQYFADLVTWYHLTWMGETVRRTTELVPHLMSKGGQFTVEERRGLFELIGGLIADLIPRYRKLSEEGRIELSTTPYYHPIAPLLLDFNSTLESMPHAKLPSAPVYPGGTERVLDHVNHAIETHRERFGETPRGMWPAEGAVSQSTLMLLARKGIEWVATGQGVLVNSLHEVYKGQSLPDKNHYLYRPYLVNDGENKLYCFFRDDRLSDLIGFEYAKWYGRDAVNNFVHQLERIYWDTPQDEAPLVSIILDGENAWEYYPYNGFYFLSELYEALVNHPFIHMTTFRGYLDACIDDGKNNQGELDFGDSCPVPGTLPRVVAGSWVYGTFSTWIGSPEKNHAWDLLCAAKQSFDMVMASGRLSEEERQAATRQLADCEASDWFWWFGDYNPGPSVESFDKLYRENLSNLYRLLKIPVPEQLSIPISHGGGHADAGGTMRKSKF